MAAGTKEIPDLIGAGYIAIGAFGLCALHAYDRHDLCSNGGSGMGSNQSVLGHLVGGGLCPHVELIDLFVFLLMVADVVAYRGLISAHRRHKISPVPRSSALHSLASVPRLPERGESLSFA